MNIRTKTLGITLVVVVAGITAVYTIASPLIMRGFVQVEDDKIHQNTLRATEALQADITSLNGKLTDWADWDDAYNFVVGKNPAYIQTNFSHVLDNPIYDAQLYFDANGHLLYAYDEVKRPKDLIATIQSSKLLGYGKIMPKEDETYSRQGLLVSNGTVVMVAAQPILKSDGTGPAHGTLLFLNYVTDKYLQSLSKQTHLQDVSFYSSSNPSNPRDIQELLANHQGMLAITKPGENKAIGYAFLKDVTSKTTVVVAATLDRAIYQQGLRSIELFRDILVGTAVVFLAVLFFLLELIVTRRLTRLTNEVTAIKGDPSLQHRLHFTGNDEVAKLAVSINSMLSRIKLSNEEVSKLVAELKHEKTGVEKQVAQRTVELNAQKDRFLSSINSLPLGFILTDEAGKILMTNPILTTIIGLRDITLEGLEGLASPLHPLLAEAAKSAKTRKNKSDDVTTTDGRSLHVSTAPVISTNDNSVEGVVVLVEDVTEEKIVERSKQEFFSIASHELRTPLTAIRGNTQMIQEFYPEVLKDEGLHEMIEDIHTSSIRLIDIVNDFLDASSLEQGKIKFDIQDFAIDAVIEKVTEEMSSVAASKNLYLETAKTLTQLPKVHGDANRIKQVVYNLVGNAMKFTEEGGVKISAAVDESGKMIKVRVTDTGPGITPEGQQLLFHKFQQTNESLHTRDATRGTGLGLYISKLIVEQMGGTMQLDESEPGKGSTFSFTVPVA